jgi:hypothetical protein
MALLGSVLGRLLTLAVVGGVGLILGGPVGAGIAMSEATVLAHTVGLAALLAPL